MKIKKHIFRITSFLICLVLISCADRLSFPKIEKGIFSKEKIRKNTDKKIKVITGDTLKSIASKYNVSIRELIKYNKLNSPYILKPGKTIKIPFSKNYIIKKGDTLFKIAECSLVSIEDLRKRNKSLKEKKLIIGKKIKLPYYANPESCNINFKKKIIKNKKISKTKKIFQWPAKGNVIATFGIKKSGRRNDGINISAPKGTPVRVAKSGKVIYRGNELPAWGNLVLVKHDQGWTTAYAHLEKFYVKLGAKLRVGDIIGSVGKSGNVDDHQLHFQVRKNSKPLDPLKYLIK